VAALLSQIANVRQQRELTASTRQATQNREAFAAGSKQRAQNPDWWVRAETAKHPNCPPEVMQQLAHDLEPAVRHNVAANPHTPPAVLEQLAADPEPDVRWYVADNPATPDETLQRLLSDPYQTIAQQAAANPGLPPAAIAMWQLTRDQQ